MDLHDSKYQRQQRLKRALGLRGFRELTWVDQSRGAGEVLTIASVTLEGLVVLDQVPGEHDPFDLDIFTHVKAPRR